MSERQDLRQSYCVRMMKLIEVKITDNTAGYYSSLQNMVMCIRFNETDVRSTGRTSMGVRGMNLT